MSALRIKLAWLLLGSDFGAFVAVLWLIRERARKAITPDGRVNLAECQPLAEVLYEQVPGTWLLTISRTSEEAGAP